MSKLAHPSSLLPYGSLLLLVLVAPHLPGIRSFRHELVLVGILAIVAIGLGLLMGYAGQVSLGHAAFYGLGAYTSGVVSKAGLHPLVALPIGLLLTGTLAYVVARPIFRLHGHYLAMATLGLGVIVFTLIRQLEPITGGQHSLIDIPRLEVAGFRFDTDLSYYYLVWACTCAVVLTGRNLIDSRSGLALRAIHGSEVAAESLGVDTTGTKVKVFVLSAVLGSLAGSLYAHFSTVLTPHTFGLELSIQLVVMVVLGGSESVFGPVLGAALVTLLTPIMREMSRQITGGSGGQVEIVVFGLILMLMMVFLPRGLVPGLAALFRRRAAAPAPIGTLGPAPVPAGQAVETGALGAVRADPTGREPG